jgi:hypothetical protein
MLISDPDWLTNDFLETFSIQLAGPLRRAFFWDQSSPSKVDHQYQEEIRAIGG